VKPEILALADRLAQSGESFALATVVWARAPSSGKPGATALITADRKVTGWIGGACAEPIVIREALRTLEDGTARLLFLGTPDELAEHQRDGVVTVPIACQSEGALEVYVEPVLPSPQIIVIGRSPAAETLAALALQLGWRSSVYDADASPGGAHGVDRMLDEVGILLDERTQAERFEKSNGRGDAAEVLSPVGPAAVVVGEPVVPRQLP